MLEILANLLVNRTEYVVAIRIDNKVQELIATEKYSAAKEKLASALESPLHIEFTLERPQRRQRCHRCDKPPEHRPDLRKRQSNGAVLAQRCRILIQCLVPTIEFQELGIPLLFHEYLAVTMCLSLLIRFHA